MKRAPLLLGMCWLAWAQTTSWQEKAAQGRNALRAKNFNEAVANLDEALSQAPSDQLDLLATLQVFKAQALQGRGDILQALQCVKIALRYTPNDADIKKYLAELEAASVNHVATSRDIARSLQAAKGFPPTANTPDSPSSAGTVNLHINFEFDKDILDDSGKAQTAELAAALKDGALAGSKFLLIGHTDLQGKPVYNDALSLRRAQTILRTLVQDYQVAPERLQAEGHGMREPLTRGTNAADHAMNRRVAIQVLP